MILFDLEGLYLRCQKQMIKIIRKHGVSLAISVVGTFVGGVLLFHYPEMVIISADLFDSVKSFLITVGAFFIKEIHLPIWVLLLTALFGTIMLASGVSKGLRFLGKSDSDDAVGQSALGQASKSDENIEAFQSLDFFAYRFGQAFPGLREIKWFYKGDAVKRLEKLFEDAFVKKGGIKKGTVFGGGAMEIPVSTISEF